MKSLVLVIVSLCIGVLGGYFFARMNHHRELYAQVLQGDLTSSRLLIRTLHALDSGDIKKTRQIAMLGVHIAVGTIPSWAKEAAPTGEQREEMVELARDALDYMLLHRDEWDPRLPSVHGGVKGLGRILSGTNDLRRLAELTNHLAKLEVGKQ